MGLNLKPDLSKLVYLAIGAFLLPKAMAFFKSKV